MRAAGGSSESIIAATAAGHREQAQAGFSPASRANQGPKGTCVQVTAPPPPPPPPPSTSGAGQAAAASRAPPDCRPAGQYFHTRVAFNLPDAPRDQFWARAPIRARAHDDGAAGRRPARAALLSRAAAPLGAICGRLMGARRRLRGSERRLAAQTPGGASGRRLVGARLSPAIICDLWRPPIRLTHEF